MTQCQGESRNKIELYSIVHINTTFSFHLISIHQVIMGNVTVNGNITIGNNGQDNHNVQPEYITERNNGASNHGFIFAPGCMSNHEVNTNDDVDECTDDNVDDNVGESIDGSTDGSIDGSTNEGTNEGTDKCIDKCIDDETLTTTTTTTEIKTVVNTVTDNISDTDNISNTNCDSRAGKVADTISASISNPGGRVIIVDEVRKLVGLITSHELTLCPIIEVISADSSLGDDFYEWFHEQCPEVIEEICGTLFIASINRNNIKLAKWLLNKYPTKPITEYTCGHIDGCIICERVGKENKNDNHMKTLRFLLGEKKIIDNCDKCIHSLVKNFNVDERGELIKLWMKTKYNIS